MSSYFVGLFIDGLHTKTMVRISKFPTQWEREKWILGGQSNSRFKNFRKALGRENSIVMKVKEEFPKLGYYPDFVVV